jgi:hypothetical protein
VPRAGIATNWMARNCSLHSLQTPLRIQWLPRVKLPRSLNWVLTSIWYRGQEWWRCTCTSPYVLMTWLINHRGNFTFHFILSTALGLNSIECDSVLNNKTAFTCFGRWCPMMSVIKIIVNVFLDIAEYYSEPFLLLLFLVEWDSPLGTAATTGLLYQPHMIDDGDCGTLGGMKIFRGNRSTRTKPIPVPLCPPQIPHDLTRAGTLAAAVGSQRLTAWAMARPNLSLREP